MFEIDIRQLLKENPQWVIGQANSNKIELISVDANINKNALVIMTHLYEQFPNKKWSFQIELNKLIAEVKEHSKYGRMYTSGCFDIFHYGHLNIISKTKELCDYLIVGVSTDELILKEKGKKPVIPFEERIKVVQSIGLVDEVIAQTDKNKQQIVDTYGIDAISVGSDWKGRYPKVTCEMEYFDYTANVSSTILRNTLKLS